MEKKNNYTVIETNLGKAVKGFATFEEAEKYAESNNCPLHYARFSQGASLYEVGDRASDPYCIVDFIKDDAQVFGTLQEYLAELESYKAPETSGISPEDEEYEFFIAGVEKEIETAAKKFAGLGGNDCIIRYNEGFAEKKDYLFTEIFDDGDLFTICALPNG